MKLPTPLLKFWQQHRRLASIGILLAILLLAGIVFRVLTPPAAPEVAPPSYAPITPKAGLRSPQNVNLSRLSSTITIPSTLTAYQFILGEFDNQQQIATTLGFTRLAQKIEEISLYSNSRFSLALNPQAHTLNLSAENVSEYKVEGEFEAVQDLTEKTILTLKALNIYDPRIEFELTGFAYWREIQTEYESVTAAEAEVIELYLNPTLNTLPIYRQEPLIAATYNKESTLVKLAINYPIGSLSEGEETNLLDPRQISRLPTSAFFPLYITPANKAEAFSGPLGLGSITPEQLALGYFLDEGSTLLQPIFTLRGNAAANQPYIYATLAYPTTARP